MKIEFILDEGETFTPLRIAEALDNELLSDTLSNLVDYLIVILKHKRQGEKE